MLLNAAKAEVSAKTGSGSRLYQRYDTGANDDLHQKEADDCEKNRLYVFIVQAAQIEIGCREGDDGDGGVENMYKGAGQVSAQSLTVKHPPQQKLHDHQQFTDYCGAVPAAVERAGANAEPDGPHAQRNKEIDAGLGQTAMNVAQKMHRNGRWSLNSESQSPAVWSLPAGPEGN